MIGSNGTRVIIKHKYKDVVTYSYGYGRTYKNVKRVLVPYKVVIQKRG